MGLYNLLSYEGECPHCLKTWDRQAQLFFGYKDVSSYAIGDCYRWSPEHPIKGFECTRPEGGNLDGPGWVECPICDEDFHVLVKVRDDILMGVSLDTSRPGIKSKQRDLAAFEEMLLTCFWNLSRAEFVGPSIDVALDLRDGPEFDSEWVRVDALVSVDVPYVALRPGRVEQEGVDRVQALGITGEVLAYVSDDLNLLRRSKQAGLEDPWLSALLLRYTMGRFPRGELTPDFRTLIEVVTIATEEML